MPAQHHQICTPVQTVITVISRVKTVLQMEVITYMYCHDDLKKIPGD